MARLTEKQKKAVPRSQRGVPGKSGTGSYPMPDAAHARAALGFWAMHHSGPAPFAAKARRILRKLKANRKNHKS